MSAWRALSVVALSLTACGAPKYGRSSGNIGALTVRAVDWNPTHADLGRVDAVADSGEDVVVFGDRGATILSSGVVLANDPRVTGWSAAATIPAPDGSGRWIVAVDTGGRVWRVRARASLEAVSDRYGLGNERVREVAALGGALVAFALGERTSTGPTDGGLALADATRVLRLDFAPFHALAGGGGRGATLAEDAIRFFTPGRPERDVTFELPGARGVAIDDSGRLAVTTERAFYAENDRGGLSLRYVTDATLGLPVASGTRVWFADGQGLGVWQEGRVSTTGNAPLARPAAPDDPRSPARQASTDARLIGSSSGDVWSLRNGANGALQRWALETTDSATSDGWAHDVQPVFARACTPCHFAGGIAGVDLSTRAAWETKRVAIRQRVVEERTMPPSGHTLSDTDRRAIEAWVSAAVR